MQSLSTHLGAMMEIDGSTIFILTTLCGAVMRVIKDKVTSVFTLLMIYPVAMATSFLAYYTFVTLSLFNVKNMGEWLIWTIMAGTLGTFVAIGAAIIGGSLMDRGGKPVAMTGQ